MQFGPAHTAREEGRLLPKRFAQDRKGPLRLLWQRFWWAITPKASRYQVGDIAAVVCSRSSAADEALELAARFPYPRRTWTFRRIEEEQCDYNGNRHYVFIAIGDRCG